jgi:hypothetical protein
VSEGGSNIMEAIYRSAPCERSRLPLTPEDEMTLTLSAAERPPSTWGYVIVALLAITGLASLVRPSGPGCFFIVCSAWMLAIRPVQRWKRRRYVASLQRRGFEVPDELAKP